LECFILFFWQKRVSSSGLQPKQGHRSPST
jgi:hypothetical protein